MSEFTHKPGTFSLFKNLKKDKETQPDYRGEGADMGGKPIEVSCWLKTSAKGNKYMSCSFKAPFKQDRDERPAPEPRRAPADDEDIPF